MSGVRSRDDSDADETTHVVKRRKPDTNDHEAASTQGEDRQEGQEDGGRRELLLALNREEVEDIRRDLGYVACGTRLLEYVCA